MAKLPPKPMNVVHEYFPVGTDGQSPFNRVEPAAYKATGLVPEKRTVTAENKHLFDDTPANYVKEVAAGPTASEVEKDQDEKNEKKKKQQDAWKQKLDQL